MSFCQKISIQRIISYKFPNQTTLKNVVYLFQLNFIHILRKQIWCEVKFTLIAACVRQFWYTYFSHWHVKCPFWICAWLNLKPSHQQHIINIIKLMIFTMISSKQTTEVCYFSAFKSIRTYIFKRPSLKRLQMVEFEQ